MYINTEKKYSYNNKVIIRRESAIERAVKKKIRYKLNGKPRRSSSTECMGGERTQGKEGQYF